MKKLALLAIMAFGLISFAFPPLGLRVKKANVLAPIFRAVCTMATFPPVEDKWQPKNSIVITPFHYSIA